MSIEEFTTLSPFRLRPWFSPRPWGSSNLSPWYEIGGAQEPIGEVWLTGDECVVDTGVLAGVTLGKAVATHGSLLGAKSGRFPLLAKVLFPSDKLSVQVHPDDVGAQRLSCESTGKTECWYVLGAEPGAHVALGFKQGVTAEVVRRAVAEGTLEELLQLVPVAAHDMIYVEAGTVHAIYPGVVLLETQQNSDLTYRLYDYGRERELHLDQALAAMRFDPTAGKVERRICEGHVTLIDAKYFRVDSFWLAAGESATGLFAHLGALSDEAAILFVAAGRCCVHVEGAQFSLDRGQAGVVPARSGRWELRAEQACEIVCTVPR